MNERIYCGKKVILTDDGYFAEPSTWTREMAYEIAGEEKLELTDQHFSIMEFMRSKFLKGEPVSIRSINHSGIMDVKTFYRLFPGAPLKKASKIAGLPKPSSCI